MMEIHKYNSDLAENWTRDAESFRQMWNQLRHWCNTQITNTLSWQLAIALQADHYIALQADHFKLTTSTPSWQLALQV